MSKLLVTLFSVFLTFETYASEDEKDPAKQQHLTLERPDKIKSVVARSFEDVSSLTTNSSNYRYYGCSSYGFMEIDDGKLLLNIIQNSKEKEVCILDIGAGNFTWAKSMSIFLNKNLDKLADKTIHFVSLSGESYSGETLIQDQVCFLHNRGSFCIEDLITSFSKDEVLKRFAEQKFNLIVSRYTFIHIADPVGTFLRSYNCLKQGGYICMDGFQVLYDDRKKVTHLHENMVQLLEDTGEPYLVKNWGDNRGLYQFLLKKTKDDLKLPMVYSGYSYLEVANTIEHVIACFKKTSPFLNWESIYMPDSNHFTGSSELHEWLVKADLRCDEYARFDYIGLVKKI